MLDRVEEIAAADGVVSLRHGDALKEWPRARKAGEREIADHPPISDLIIHNKWVAIVLVLTWRACQVGEERVVRDRARQHVPIFVKNRECLIDRFDVVIRADIAIAVGRRASAELGCSTPLKGQQRCRSWRWAKESASA